MKRFFSVGLLLAAFGPVSAVVALDVENPPVGVFADDWFAVMLDGRKSGHMHSTMERRKRSGADVVRTGTEMVMTAGRGEVKITVSVDQQTEETLDGKPLSFSQTMKLGAFPTTTRGKIKDGKVTVTTSQLGQQGQTKTYDLPKGAMMSWAVYREQLRRGLKPGTKYELPMYEPSMSVDQLTPATIEIGEKKTIDVFGRKVEAIESKQTVSVKGLLGKGMDVATTIWMKEDGTPVRLEMSMMNIPIEVLACAKPIALAKNDPGDLMAGSLLPVRPIDAAAANQVTYRLWWKKGAVNDEQIDLQETRLQKVEKKGASERIITVTRASARTATSKPSQLSKEERERCLAPASAVNYTDPAVAKLVKEAAGDEKDPRKLGERLCRFVSSYITSKNLGIGFATASEVARSREGDCTEHGTLLAALGRGAGIPTRIVTGLVYADRFNGKPNVFVGHCWTQFWIDGEWVDLDAALGQTDIDPTHIVLGISSAADTGVGDMVGSLWVTMQNFSLDVLKIDPPQGGPTTRSNGN